MRKLDGKIDELLECIANGDTFRAMADNYNVSISTLHDYFSQAEHSARVNAALKLSAGQYANKAEDALLNAPGTLPEITRARELAQHYRWMASKRSPKEYADKIEIEQKVTVTNAPEWLEATIPSIERPNE